MGEDTKFRTMRRFKQQLTEAECKAILEGGYRGFLAVNGEEGYPYAIPMNFLYYDNHIYFHSAVSGHKIDAITANNKVSFCVYDSGFKNDGEWALNISSVIVFGKMYVVVYMLLTEAAVTLAAGAVTKLQLRVVPVGSAADAALVVIELCLLLTLYPRRFPAEVNGVRAGAS